MRKAPVFAALALLVITGPVAAQAQAPKPAAKEERPRLNLKLDQPARLYVREAPPEGADGKAAAEKNLPSLGGGAAALERPPEPRVRTSPYPKDTETGR